MTQRFKRASRVAELVHVELSRLLREEVRDPRVTATSVTDVRLSDDLRHAKVYVLPLGGQGDAEEHLEALDRTRGFLRSRLAQKLQLRYTPELRFYRDEHFVEAMRMTELLGQFAEEEGEE